MDYFETCDVKSNNISQMDYFDLYDESCVKSSNFTISDQCIDEFCDTNVCNNTIDDVNYFSVPIYDAVESCKLTKLPTYTLMLAPVFDFGEVLRQGRVCNFQQKLKSLDTHINLDRLSIIMISKLPTSLNLGFHWIWTKLTL
jgi:hypothetical protein